MYDKNFADAELEFFRVEAGSAPEGARARAYVEELKASPVTGERITPLEKALLRYLAFYSNDNSICYPNIPALAAYLDVFVNDVHELLMALIFKGVLRPQMALKGWKETTNHVYVFAALERSVA